MLMKAFQSARQEQVMNFFLSVIDASGTTFEQSLLGARGRLTIDPENVEALLSKQFNGARAPRPLTMYSSLTRRL